MTPLHSKSHFARLGVFALACAALIPAAASAQATRPFPRSRLPVSGYDRVEPRAADLGRTVRVGLAEGASARTLALPRGKSAVIDLPVDARDVLVSDPKVADVVLSTPRRIYVMGLASGQTDAAFMDASGRQILRLEIRVDQDVSALTQTLGRLLPGSSIRAEAVNDSLVLAGEVSSPADADKAMRVAQSFVARPEQVINMISVAGQEQVMLKVRIVEVSRQVIKQLGFDLGAVTGQLGMPQYSFLKAPTYGVNGSYLGSATGGYKVDTTSQPVSGFPFSNLFNGLSQASGLIPGANAAGIPIAQIGTYVSGYLNGSQTLNPGQTTFVQNYLSGLIGTINTPVSAPAAGITSSNIAQLEQNYLSGGAGLTAAQTSWLQSFNSALPSYNANAQYSLASGQQSLFRDRSNPANYVQKGMAGSSGLNQADAMIQAFERVGLVRTLAEPNLSAVSGESAKFLAGGEFPVPVSQDNNGRVTVAFKQFGVGLGFTPVVLSQGRISLKLSTEVSELTNVGAFSMGTGTSGPSLSVPGLNVRRAETVVELPSGGAMMIAGLLQSTTKQTLDSLPGLMQLPILGSLFRSRDYQNNETELVVIITPYLVKPVRPDQLQTPADGLQIADDATTNLLGRLNKGFGKPAQAAPGKTYQGPVGYVVE